jgi:hypothetical protein
MSVSSRTLVQPFHRECRSVREFGIRIPALIPGDRAGAAVLRVCNIEQLGLLWVSTLLLRSWEWYGLSQDFVHP